MKSSIILLIFFLFAETSYAKRSKKIATIPFDIVGSYIVIKAKINNTSTLNLILDSGIRSTLITELTAQDSVTLLYSENIFLKGLGTGNQLKAFTSKGNTIQVGKINLPDQTIYLLEEDVFNLSKHVGYKINGLIGTDFFSGYVVKIDYNAQRITFFDKDGFTPPKGFTQLTLQIEGQKMFTFIPILDAGRQVRLAKMLVDTGAELGAWFRAYGENPVKIPATRIRGFIGQGLNGEINGFLGRIPRIQIGKSILKNQIVSFPDSLSIAEAFAETQREGTLGSQILNRFNLIFDEGNNLLYVKPNSGFKRPSTYNIAGIELIYQPMLRLTEVQHIWPGSPAEKAGIIKGDQLLEINGKKGFDASINEIKGLFELEYSKPVKLILLRDGKPIATEIEMKSKL